MLKTFAAARLCQALNMPPSRSALLALLLGAVGIAFAPIFVSIRFITGLVLALGGATLVISASFRLSPQHVLGDGLGLLTAGFYAGYILCIKRLRASLTTARVMAGSGLVTCIALFFMALLFRESLIAETLDGWAVLVGLAWISHTGGQGLIAYALAYLPASFTSVALLLQPVMAALLAWVLLREPLGGCKRREGLWCCLGFCWRVKRWLRLFRSAL